MEDLEVMDSCLHGCMHLHPYLSWNAPMLPCSNAPILFFSRALDDFLFLRNKIGSFCQTNVYFLLRMMLLWFSENCSSSRSKQNISLLFISWWKNVNIFCSSKCPQCFVKRSLKRKIINVEFQLKNFFLSKLN